MEFFEIIKSYKRRPIVMAWCRISESCVRYKIDIGNYDRKSKRILPGNGKQRDICVYIQKIITVMFGRKIEKIL